MIAGIILIMDSRRYRIREQNRDGDKNIPHSM
jgi:hypothetical protein